MADHLSSCTDRLVTSDHLNSERGSNESIESSGESSRAQGTTSLSTTKSMNHETEEEEATKQMDVTDEEEPLLQSVECRVCQEEDSVKNLESPCSCSGSLKLGQTLGYGNKGPNEFKNVFSARKTYVGSDSRDSPASTVVLGAH